MSPISQTLLPVDEKLFSLQLKIETIRKGSKYFLKYKLLVKTSIITDFVKQIVPTANMPLYPMLHFTGIPSGIPNPPHWL